jgi:hypothetical protein
VAALAGDERVVRDQRPGGPEDQGEDRLADVDDATRAVRQLGSDEEDRERHGGGDQHEERRPADRGQRRDQAHDEEGQHVDAARYGSQRKAVEDGRRRVCLELRPGHRRVRGGGLDEVLGQRVGRADDHELARELVVGHLPAQDVDE